MRPNQRTVILFGLVALFSLNVILRYPHELHQLLVTDANNPSLVVFYNIYVGADVNRSMSIIQEQMAALTNSSIFSSIDSLRFASIGQPTIAEATMANVCSALECVHLGHQEAADEEATLTPLYEYCVQNPDHRVLYLHTKGSSRDDPGQKYWRANMMEAVLHADCHSRRCDACGLQAEVYPWAHYTGNFWTADCSYIHKLLPPASMPAAMQANYEHVAALNATCQLQLVRPKDSAWYALSRYSLESWIGSHPRARLCDLFRSAGETIRSRFVAAEELAWAEFPRHNLSSKWNLDYEERAQYSLANEEFRLRDDQWLPGRLVRWSRLYGEFPPPDSWVWSFFPDGDFWQARIAEFGLEVVEKTTERVNATHGCGTHVWEDHAF